MEEKKIEKKIENKIENNKKKKYNPYWKKNKNKSKPPVREDQGEQNEQYEQADQVEQNAQIVKSTKNFKNSKNVKNVKNGQKGETKEEKKQTFAQNAISKKPKKQNTVGELYEEIKVEPIIPEEYIVSDEVPEEYDSTKTVIVVGVKYKDGGKTYYFDPAGLELEAGEEVIVDTSRGMEFGFVSVPNKEVRMSELVADLKSVIRRATSEDKEKYQINKQLEEKAKKIWPQRVAAFGLVMQLVDVEYTFDNTKLIFYYTADGRVDFRELVKDLAGLFHARIELRQIGVRDEAKLLGGLGICGRPFCCKEFLSEFAQVSIKMAKEQNLSLTSSKISGNCGRLMCCLSFEQKVYEMEYATFPKVDSLVETSLGRGVICESNFLTGRIKVKLLDADRAQPAKVFTADQIKVIGMLKRKETEETEE